MVSRRRLAVAVLALVAAGAATQACAAPEAAETGSGESAQTEQKEAINDTLSSAERKDIVGKKATCPFIGTAIAMEKAIDAIGKRLPGVRSFKLMRSAAEPLAPVVGEGSVEALGNTGKNSTLGFVLTLFALGNHGIIPQSHANGVQPTGEKVPANTFSLDFPASQGSHPGHSFILQGDPNKRESGTFSGASFKRLIEPRSASASVCPTGTAAPISGHAERVNEQTGAPDPNGVLVVRRSELAKFIAENVSMDPNAKAIGKNQTSLKLAADAIGVEQALRDGLTDLISGAGAGGTRAEQLEQHRPLAQKLTLLLGEDNLIGSSGEFGLLLAFLWNSPKTIGKTSHDPMFAVSDLKLMFQGDANGRRFPDGWQDWNKDAFVWVTQTLALTTASAHHYHSALKSCPER